MLWLAKQISCFLFALPLPGRYGLRYLVSFTSQKNNLLSGYLGTKPTLGASLSRTNNFISLTSCVVLLKDVVGKFTHTDRIMWWISKGLASLNELDNITLAANLFQFSLCSIVLVGTRWVKSIAFGNLWTCQVEGTSNEWDDNNSSPLILFLPYSGTTR